MEVNLEARRVIGEIAARMERGWVLAIDYGYTAREMVRFPQGTLMSYRRHQALEDVLAEPGERDITAHVNFTALSGHAAEAGFEIVRFERMAQLLLDAGEGDGFQEALRAGDEREALRLRMQLKTLLYGMGETFRALVARKK
jgi:SAM-dependent MidA family methyltransferase